MATATSGKQTLPAINQQTWRQRISSYKRTPLSFLLFFEFSLDPIFFLENFSRNRHDTHNPKHDCKSHFYRSQSFYRCHSKLIGHQIICRKIYSGTRY